MPDPALTAAYQEAQRYWDALPDARVSAAAPLDELRARLCHPTPETPRDAAEVVRDLVRDTDGGLLASAGGRFFAWAISGGLPAAVAADWLTSVWDQAAALYACAPAAAVVEEAAGEWLKDLLGLPTSSSFALVSGCQMAHATCLAAARHALLARIGHDVERDGLSGAPRIRILASNRHGSIERAVRLLGLGESNVTELPLDDRETLTPAVLDDHLRAAAGAPVIVILQAGDLNTGSFDPYAELIPLAHRHGAWVHVDGAFGLWAAASPTYRSLLTGMELADSWATDGHKWLNVPYDCGYAFTAHPDAHRAAMSHRAPYLTHDVSARDQIDWNPEWSRRARGFPTYAALRQLGRTGVAELVDRCCSHARALVEGIGALPGAEVLWTPVLNQGLVGFGSDERTERVIEQILQDGSVFFKPTTWRGQRVMRISVLNWRTTEADVATAIAAVRRSLAYL